MLFNHLFMYGPDKVAEHIRAKMRVFVFSIVSARFIYQNVAENVLNTNYKTVLPNLCFIKRFIKNKIVGKKTQKFYRYASMRFDAAYRPGMIYIPKCR